MGLTVGDLKVGERLIIGKYGVGDNDQYPIVWLKGTPNNDFISEYVLDYIAFDAMERNNEIEDTRYAGNRNYALSNILQFMNSAEESWYRPMHPYDIPPRREYIRQRTNPYNEHLGFLCGFEEYETEQLKQETCATEYGQVSTVVRLPFASDIFDGSGNKFQLFNRKGVRTNGTFDVVSNRSGDNFEYTSYLPYWVMDNQHNTRGASIIDRSGRISQIYPADCAGLRPICTVKPDTEICTSEDGTFCIKPREIKRDICTDEELYSLLGIASIA